MESIVKSALTLTFLFAAVCTSRADVAFNISPSAIDDTIILEIIGTGTVTSLGDASTAGIAGSASTPPALRTIGIDLQGSGISLDGQEAIRLNLDIINGLATSFLSFPLEGQVALGTPLSDLNGVFLIDFSDITVDNDDSLLFSYEELRPGQYLYAGPFGGSTDVGEVTVNIAAIPEPASGCVLLLGLTLQAMRRRRN